MTNVKVEVASPRELSSWETVNFLVDSGAFYSVVDKKILKKLGIAPISEKEFILANGKAIVRKVGGAVFTFKNEKGYAPVVFGEKGDSNLLGAMTLESLGLGLDPFRRELFKIPLALGGMPK